MLIQFNTDNNITESEKIKAPLVELIKSKLKRFEENITRIEVHLSDENGKKTGKDDIRCMLEARPEGLQPIAVSNDGDTKEEALRGAIDKLKSALDSKFGKLNSK